MIFIKMTNSGLERQVPRQKVNYYKEFGWKIVGANPDTEEVKTPQVSPVDSGTIIARPPKKKTAKSAEIAPEAAQEDQGNDISKGD